MMIYTDEVVGHDCGNRVGIMVDFGLIPGTLERQDHALVCGGIGLVLRDRDQS